MKEKVLVIIPAYNEQHSILKTLKDLDTNCPQMDKIVVNDCSKDQTRAMIQDAGYDYLDLSNNLGIGGAVQAGYRYACCHDYDIAIQFDGDGQHDARFLKDLIKPIEQGAADITIGSRFIERTGFQSSGARRAGINILSGLIRVLCGVKVLDVTSGMRAVNKQFIREYADEYAQDYPEPEAILYAGLRGARIEEVPVQMRERENGESSINSMKSVYYMIKVSIALIIGRLTKGECRK